MTDSTLYFIQQTVQDQQDVVVAGRVDTILPDGALLVHYRIDDQWAPSMNVIPPYERPNIRFWRKRDEWEAEWQAMMEAGEKLKKPEAVA